MGPSLVQRVDQDLHIFLLGSEGRRAPYGSLSGPAGRPGPPHLPPWLRGRRARYGSFSGPAGRPGPPHLPPWFRGTEGPVWVLLWSSGSTRTSTSPSLVQRDGGPCMGPSLVQRVDQDLHIFLLGSEGWRAPYGSFSGPAS